MAVLAGCAGSAQPEATPNPEDAGVRRFAGAAYL